MSADLERVARAVKRARYIRNGGTPDAARIVAQRVFIGADELADAAGIAIAPPAPSEEMVKLATAIVTAAPVPPERVDRNDLINGALAALQHVERVVRDAQNGAGSVEDGALGFILKRIGSNKS